MREPIVVANWKMNGTLAEARALAAGIRDGCAGVPGVRVAICPPLTALAAVREVLAGSPLLLGAQDVFWEAKGAFTGAVSAPMLADAGVRVVLVGHSERRGVFGDDDAAVRRKTTAVLAAGLTPLVCVGETAADRAAGRARRVIEAQLDAALSSRTPEELARCWIAYEPVWAVGTHHPATATQVAEAHAELRALLASLAGPHVAAARPILYGGSVTAANAPELCAVPDLDGGLVGGASLHAAELAGIVRALAAAKRV